MSEITFSREENGRKGRYVARVPGLEGEGEMTFTVRSGDRFSIDHTEVADTMAGQGVASALARHVIEDARSRGQKIIPLCPYFRKYVDRHKDETADVIAD